MSATATWSGRCTACHRESVEGTSRRTHGERVLCERCAARPYPRPSADGLDGHTSNGHGARVNGAKPNGLHITRASDVRVRAVEFLYPGRVPIGALTLLAGDPGLGKSTWTCGLAAGVTAGRHGPAATVLIANAEDSPAHVVVPRLAAAGANLEIVEFFAVADTSTTVGERPSSCPATSGA